MLQDIYKEYPKVIPQEYKIIPGDQLSIAVYSLHDETEKLFGEFNSSFTRMDRGETTQRYGGEQRMYEGTTWAKPIAVYADGTIDFPYVGNIPVAGLTIFEAQQLISVKLNEYSPGTTADVTLFNRYFSVLGEVGSNRVRMNKDKITIFEALASISGLSTFADRTRVSILRQTIDGSEIKTFDLRSKDIIDSDFYYIQANDVIYIPQSKARFIGGTTSLSGLIGWGGTIFGIFYYIINRF